MTRYRITDLGSGSFSWRDLYVLVRRWQKLPGNALAAAIAGHEVPTWDQQVLSIMVDQLAVANWQRKGGKGGKPKPLKRWWQKTKARVLGADPIPISKFSSWWDSKKRR